MSTFKKFTFFLLMSLTVSVLTGCGSDDAATTAAGTSTVTIQGSGSAN